MSIATKTTVRTTRITAVKTQMDAAGAGANATIDFRSGAAAGPDNADTGTLAGTLPLSAPPSSSISGAVLTLLGTPLSVTAANSCTMAHFRVNDRGGVAVFEGTVGTSGADINFAGGVVVLAGGTITLSSYTLTEAA
jgi:hypothetical protein